MRGASAHFVYLLKRRFSMKRLKKILPLLCAFFLIFGTSMTVLASTFTGSMVQTDYVFSSYDDIDWNIDDLVNYYNSSASDDIPDGVEIKYWFAYGSLSYDGSSSLYVYLFSEPVYYESTTNALYVPKDAYQCSMIFYADSRIVAFSKTVQFTVDGIFIDFDSFDNGYTSNFNIYDEDGNIFFRCPPISLKKSMGELQTRVTTSQQAITMIAILLLACLIGSVTLLPRLLHSLAK